MTADPASIRIKDLTSTWELYLPQQQLHNAVPTGTALGTQVPLCCRGSFHPHLASHLEVHCDSDVEQVWRIPQNTIQIYLSCLKLKTHLNIFPSTLYIVLDMPDLAFSYFSSFSCFYPSFCLYRHQTCFPIAFMLLEVRFYLELHHFL